MSSENRELQQAVLRKDLAMEEMDKRLAQEKEDAEVICNFCCCWREEYQSLYIFVVQIQTSNMQVRHARTLDRLRGEYEVTFQKQKSSLSDSFAR